MIRLIAAKELRGLFSAPSTWLMLGLLQFILAWFFLARLDAFLQIQAQLARIANAPGATQAVAVPLFNVLALLLLMLVPVLAMRLLAEERRNQTLPLLLSAPVSAARIVLGKFLGLMVFLSAVIAAGAAVPLTLATGTQLDAGLLLGNALGLLLLASSYAALALYISALAAQPMVAALGALAALFGLWLAEIGAAGGEGGWQAVTPTSHFHSFNAGLLNSADALYYLLFTAVFLLLAIRRLNTNRTG